MPRPIAWLPSQPGAPPMTPGDLGPGTRVRGRAIPLTPTPDRSPRRPAPWAPEEDAAGRNPAPSRLRAAVGDGTPPHGCRVVARLGQLERGADDYRQRDR